MGVAGVTERKNLVLIRWRNFSEQKSLRTLSQKVTEVFPGFSKGNVHFIETKKEGRKRNPAGHHT